ncbi:release factor glutamine methyltransferase [Agromyces ramosus]|uniref:peptide chain release factor N(5)-glutamine methyltransferase n=2 Tax=Agromyces ramosus TaxID=33879 RepID=A0A4Q7MG59_9MICO|nr:release factor glutamine methyltransferase [Agromyces ramosus]
MQVDAVMTSTLWHASDRRTSVSREAYDARMPPQTLPDPALVARLRAAGCVFAEDEALLLAQAVEGRADAADELERLVARRVDGEPLEQLLGWAEFGGLRILLEPGVFVPRRRTEALAAEAVRLAGAIADEGRAPVVVDLCCGAGAIGAAVVDAVDGVELTAADVDPAAVLAARRNLEPLGAHVVAGDLFDALPRDLIGRVDVLAVNAPYVPTAEIAMMPPEARDHEARAALDGGTDGLDVHRRVAASAADWLAPGGHLLIETSRRQAPTTTALVTAGGLEARVVRDDELAATIVVGRR